MVRQLCIVGIQELHESLSSLIFVLVIFIDIASSTRALSNSYLVVSAQLEYGLCAPCLYQGKVVFLGCFD